MKIASQPDDFSGVRARLPYRIDEVLPTATIDVATVNAIKIPLGVMSLTGEASYEVDIAPYLDGIPVVAPHIAQRSGFMNHPERCVAAKLSTAYIADPEVHLPIYSDQRTFTFGSKSVPEGTILSDMPGAGEVTAASHREIAFCTTEAEVHAIVTLSRPGTEKSLRISGGADEPAAGAEWFACQHGMAALHINMRELMTRAGEEEFENMEVKVYRRNNGAGDNGNLLIEKYFRIIPEKTEGTEVHWINPYGTIDSYSFDTLVEESASIRKTMIATSGGPRALHTETETAVKVVSRLEPAAVMRWLGQVGEAPRVWMVENGIATEAFVGNLSVPVYSRTKPEPLAITLVKQ